MKKGLYEVFNLTNKYIILLTPLILYSLISSVYLAASATGKMVNIIIAVIMYTLITSAFFAGWFNMIKISVSSSVRQDTNSLMKEFVPGVGEYFLPSLGAIYNIFLFLILMFIVSFIFGAKFIGDPNISVEALSKALETADALKTFLMSLSVEQLNKLNQWNILLLITMTISYFIMILYFPALFFKRKNPYIALLISLKDLFSKNILKTLGFFTLIFMFNTIISIVSAISIGNVIMHFLLTLANFYFITLACLGMFYYYYKTFIEPQIGQNVDIRI